ncbi:MAG: glycosyltransferase [Hyphomicrobium sp.]|jgi:rSAM/selenodomain-associated transferase 1|uniref:TIGR04282 family arsenosugar biosynthesis glycosyltransferase n=1 Tax=Hyphomicrobium sp. TaxID=82 RepID=UPI0025BB58B5|nr:TIGR04282 family arsenosugar biosynthesis glycosyltransferase [Hyphomicrobium sp.]MBX9863947.1 glycosyltransferase [Hyphomicrobium sp.]
MKTNCHLVIFTRYPRLGTGKRRLAAQTGAVEALRFQRVSLANTLLKLGNDARWSTWLAVTPDHSGPWPSRYGILQQGTGDLGQRLMRVTNRLPTGPVLIIGSDVPGIPPDLIAKGFSLLEGQDAVFGPSSDGGYWAVGLRRRPNAPNPFHDVRWSTAHALSDSMRNLQGRRVALLPEIDDVDDAASLASYPKWGLLHGTIAAAKISSATRR